MPVITRKSPASLKVEVATYGNIVNTIFRCGASLGCGENMPYLRYDNLYFSILLSDWYMQYAQGINKGIFHFLQVAIHLSIATFNNEQNTHVGYQQEINTQYLPMHEL